MKKKLSDEIVCCDDCFERIGKVSAKAARLWLDFCDFYSSIKGPFVVSKKPYFLKSLKELELLGFLVTHETNDCLIVRMAGYNTTPCNYFCIGDCDERMH